MPLFAKSSLLSRLRARACARGVSAWALLLAVALVVGGLLAVTAPMPVAVVQEAAASGGHCADHAAPLDDGAAPDQQGAHAHPGNCCDAMCACACTHAITGVPLRALRLTAPDVRTDAFNPPSIRVALSAPPLRPPIA